LPIFDCPAEKSSIKYALHAWDPGLLVTSAGGVTIQKERENSNAV